MESNADLDRLGDEIAELSAHLESATARLLDRIREFDARAGWNTGFRSCAAWLSWRVGLDAGAARERVRVARALGTLPRLAEALARGEVSYAKVRAVTRVATPETEERLLAVARAGTAEHVERIVRGWRRVDRRAEMRETSRQQATRGLYVYPDARGGRPPPARARSRAGCALSEAYAGRGCADDAAATGRRPGLARRDGVASQRRSGRRRRALSGRRPRRCRRPVRRRPAGPVRARRRRTRFRGNVSAPRVRREPRGDASRRRRPRRRDRSAHADDSSGAATSTSPPRSWLLLPRLWGSCRRRASHPPLGARRPDDAVEPGTALSPPPPRRPRRGLPDHARPRWLTDVPVPCWPQHSGCSGSARPAT